MQTRATKWTAKAEVDDAEFNAEDEKRRTRPTVTAPKRTWGKLTS